MSANNVIEVVKGKVNEFLTSYPVINDPLTKFSAKIKVEKAYLAIGIALIPILILFMIGSGAFIM